MITSFQSFSFGFALVTLGLLQSGAAYAQGTPAGQPPLQSFEAREQGVYFSVRGGFEHQFKANIDGGGDIGVSRGIFGVAARAEITPDLDGTFAFSYGIDDYRIRNATLMGINPWDDIHTLSASAIFSLALNSDWTIFGGPVLQFARESGADWGDSVSAGGVIGASVRLSDQLTLGGGVGVVTQIEDSARIIPIIRINWQINDRLRLSSRTDSAGSGDSGIELIYTLGGGWEIAGGGAYRFRRFRLDNTGIAPNGVGEETSIPAWIRLTWNGNPNVTVNFYGGLAMGGTLRLENSSGIRLRGEDYDAAGLLGASLSVRF